MRFSLAGLAQLLCCGTRWEPPPAAPSRALRDPDFPGSRRSQEEAEENNSCPEKFQQSHAEPCLLNHPGDGGFEWVW